MRKLMAVVAALGAGPIVAIALQTAAPAFADSPGQAPACVSQSLNPHPTDPAGQTTNSLFCASATPSGTGSGGSGSGKAGAGTGTGTTGGGSQTTLASTSTTSGSTPDESGRALIDKIAFEINEAAQLQLKTLLRIADRQRVVNAIKQIGACFEHKHKRDGGAEDVDLTSHELIS